MDIMRMKSRELHNCNSIRVNPNSAVLGRKGRITGGSFEVNSIRLIADNPLVVNNC